MKRKDTIEQILNKRITCNTSLDELNKLDELITEILDKIEDETTHDKLVRKHQEVISAIIIKYQLEDDDVEDI